MGRDLHFEEEANNPLHDFLRFSVTESHSTDSSKQAETFDRHSDLNPNLPWRAGIRGLPSYKLHVGTGQAGTGFWETPDYVKRPNRFRLPHTIFPTMLSALAGLSLSLSLGGDCEKDRTGRYM